MTQILAGYIHDLDEAVEGSEAGDLRLSFGVLYCQGKMNYPRLWELLLWLGYNRRAGYIMQKDQLLFDPLADWVFQRQKKKERSSENFLRGPLSYITDAKYILDTLIETYTLEEQQIIFSHLDKK